VKNRIKAFHVAAVCLLAMTLAGCAALTPVKQQTLEERVTGYMQAQVDKQWDRVYAYFDSSSQSAMTKDRYLSQPRKLSYTGFSIEEIAVSPAGDQATVAVRIDLLFMGYDFKRAPKKQTWIKEKGNWFVKPESQAQKTPFPAQQKKQ
jgi:hypothetical protein